MNGLILVMMFSLSSAMWSNDWTPPIAAEGAIMTIEMDVPAVPKPLPNPTPDGARKGAKLESPLDTYREAKTLIEKGNALADRGKAILDQAQRDGKITVDIRLPADSPSKQKADLTCFGNSYSTKTCPSGTCPWGTCKRRSCPGGNCPSETQAEDPSSASTESAQACNDGTCKPRRFLRWRR